MKTLTRQGIQRMTTGGTTVVGGSGSGSGGSGGGGSADYAAEAGHAQTADTADTATTATNLDANSTDWQKIARKDIAQSIAEVFTFAKGIVSTLVSKFKAGILIGANDDYGIDASGNATLNGVTASGDIQGENLTVADSASVGEDLTVLNDLGVMNDLSVGNDATIGGDAQAAKFIANIFKTLGFDDAWTDMIGKGFGVKVDGDGYATLQTDNLMVLGQMIVHTLNIREVSYIGGAYHLSPAASTVAMVQELYAPTPNDIPDTRTWQTTQTNYRVGYRLLWKADDGTTGTMNYWKQGDMAYCHTFNITQPGQYTNANNQNYMRLVCRVGTTTIDGQDYHYADLAATSGCYLYDSNNVQLTTVDGSTVFTGMGTGTTTTPKANDKVVCRGSQSDSTRQGLIIISTEGEASIGIYDGIKDFRALSYYEIHYFSKSAVRMNAAYITWKATGGNQTQDNFMSTTKEAFIHIGNAGIDITNEKIVATGNKFEWKNTNNQTILGINSDGDADFSGVVRAKILYQRYDEVELAWSGNNNYCIINASDFVALCTDSLLPSILKLSTRGTTWNNASSDHYYQIYMPDPSAWAGHQMEIICTHGVNYTEGSIQKSTARVELRFRDSRAVGQASEYWIKDTIQTVASQYWSNFAIRVISRPVYDSVTGEVDYYEWALIDNRDCYIDVTSQGS